MSSLPEYYEKTTVGGTSTHPGTDAHTSTNASTSTHTTTNPSAAQDFSTPDTSSTTTPTVPQLNCEYPPTTEIQQPRGSLSSTTDPFQVPTTDDVSKKDGALTSSVGQQSAPGRAGDIGDKVLGALGFGGSSVERPKEDQGLGEKIVNFLGA